jgi:hypothetical protein
MEASDLYKWLNMRDPADNQEEAEEEADSSEDKELVVEGGVTINSDLPAANAAQADVPAADASQVEPIDYFDGACLQPPDAFPASSILSRLANVYSCADKGAYKPEAADAALLRNLAAATPAVTPAGAPPAAKPAATAAATPAGELAGAPSNVPSSGGRDCGVPTSKDVMKNPIPKKADAATADPVFVKEKEKMLEQEKEKKEQEEKVEDPLFMRQSVAFFNSTDEKNKRAEQAKLEADAKAVARQVKQQRLREKRAKKANRQEPEPELDEEMLQAARNKVAEQQREAICLRRKNIKDEIATEVILVPLFLGKSFKPSGGQCRSNGEVTLHPMVLSCLMASDIFKEVMQNRDQDVTERQAIVTCLLMRLLPPLEDNTWWTLAAKKELIYSILALTRSYEMGAVVPTRMEGLSTTYLSTQLAVMAYCSVHPAITKEYAGAAANTTAEGMMNEHRLTILSLMKYLLREDSPWFKHMEELGFFALADKKLWECVSPILVAQDCFSRMSLNMCLTLPAALVLCAVPTTCRWCFVQCRLTKKRSSVTGQGSLVRLRLPGMRDGMRNRCSRSRRCSFDACRQAVRRSSTSCPPTSCSCTTRPCCTTRGRTRTVGSRRYLHLPP